ncbi:uncharacterized protein LOC126237076 [Schistocerca nitens]|uniref:uncharacterized protein LOC126237076 n=1 Tax=Schistocerca nitens TaxID=7011 RepID=UPI0021192EF5|nr:uncharacterized protein LOC126237076 [Schistocerca nitens]XP_049802829.1 uncharacterized protein LOC126237076 [Schistocerca nitens]
MEPCRRLVAGAVILSCILGLNAAVLKDPAIVEAATFDAKFPGAGYGTPVVGGDQLSGGALKSNFKRFVVSRGTPNFASTGNFQTVVGNPRVIDDTSLTADSSQPITNLPEVGALVEQSSNAPDSSLTVVNESREISSLDSKGGVILPKQLEDIVRVAAKFLPDRNEAPADATKEAPVIDISQSTSGHIGQMSSQVGGEIGTTAINKQSTVLTAVTPMEENRGAMKWTYYETVVSDKQDSGVPQISDVAATVEMVTDPPTDSSAVDEIAKNESKVSLPMQPATERLDDIAEGVTATEPAANFDQQEAGVTPRVDHDTTVQQMESESVKLVDVTTETEEFVGETTVVSEDWGIHRSETKEPTGRQLEDKYYHRDTEPLSEQDNEIGGSHLDVGDADVDAGGDCSRPCELGAPPRVCKFTFHVEWYHTMSKACFGCPSNASDCERPHCVPADGIERPIIVANRQMPGPTISVCQHDIVQVDVVNGMTEETTSVHWHGQHQRGSPHMDGVPFVTQCPIGPASAFRYRFVAETPGTHFWHSHTGCQRADGLYGALLVRTPRAVDAHSRLYDEEGPVLQLADWGRPLGVDKFVNHHHAAGDNKPTAILVNGRGGLRWASGQPGPPPAHFTVQQGKRYRFRVINNGFLNCPIQMSVDGHSLLVISSDGADIDPVRVESLVTYAGERWDFVLEASAAVSSYWVRFQGLMDCGAEFTKAHEVAVLRYQGSDLAMPAGNVSWEDAQRPGLSLNTLNAGPGTTDSLVMSELSAASTLQDDASLSPRAAHTFYLGYDFYAIDNPHFHHPKYYGMSHVVRNDHKLFTPQFNHLSLRLPSFPLLSQFSDLDESTTCNQTAMAGQGCESGYCECLHMLRVPLGAVVEIVLVDEGNMYNANHPFHLHGHAFRVVAMGKLGTNTSVEEVRALDRAGGIKRKLHGAPIKDTVTVPDGGFTVLRVSADNPGYWLFHCHIEFHVEVGMAVVFKVGEHSDFPPPPPGFPRCNSWLPPYPSKGHALSRLTADPLRDQQGQSSAPASGPLATSVLLLLAGLVAAGAATS